MARFQSPRDDAAWRAGIFHGIRSQALGQPASGTTPTSPPDPITDVIAEGIEEGAVRAADALEERYSGRVTFLVGLLVATALATTATAILVASKD